MKNLRGIDSYFHIMPYQPDYRYIPPAGAHMLTRLYDSFCVIFGLGKSFKKNIANSVKLNDSCVVADIGCGTGVFLEILQRKYPKARIIGIDPDKKALEIARKRTSKMNGSVQIINAFAESLPVDSNSVDACFSTLALHHMPDEIKEKALEEMYRILKPSGQIIITDFGQTDNRLMRKVLFFEKIEYIEANFKGLIPQYLERIGFKNIRIAGKKFPSIHTVLAEK